MANLLDNQSNEKKPSLLWPDFLKEEIFFPDEHFESLLRNLGFEFNDWFKYW